MIQTTVRAGGAHQQCEYPNSKPKVHRISGIMELPASVGTGACGYSRSRDRSSEAAMISDGVAGSRGCSSRMVIVLGNQFTFDGLVLRSAKSLPRFAVGLIWRESGR